MCSKIYEYMVKFNKYRFQTPYNLLISKNDWVHYNLDHYSSIECYEIFKLVPLHFSALQILFLFAAFPSRNLWMDRWNVPSTILQYYNKSCELDVSGIYEKDEENCFCKIYGQLVYDRSATGWIVNTKNGFIKTLFIMIIYLFSSSWVHSSNFVTNSALENSYMCAPSIRILWQRSYSNW